MKLFAFNFTTESGKTVEGYTEAEDFAEVADLITVLAEGEFVPSLQVRPIEKSNGSPFYRAVAQSVSAPL